MAALRALLDWMTLVTWTVTQPTAPSPPCAKRAISVHTIHPAWGRAAPQLSGLALTHDAVLPFCFGFLVLCPRFPADGPLSSLAASSSG